jgi:glucuronosyltransferase
MQYSPNHTVIQHKLSSEGNAAFFKYSDILYYKTKKFNAVQIYGSFEMKAGLELIEHQMYNEYFQHLVHNPNSTKFDLLIMECIFCPFIVLAEVMNLPIVTFNAGEPMGGQHLTIGNSFHSSILHDIYTIFKLHGTLDLLDRVKAFLYGFLGIFWSFSSSKLNDAIIQRIFPNLTLSKYDDMFQYRTKMLFSFTSTLTAPIRPTIPNFHQIGYMHIKKPKELSDDMEVKKILDKSVNGVVMVSFGSLVSDFSDELFMKFVRVFKQQPYTFIWKANPDRWVQKKVYFEDF